MTLHKGTKHAVYASSFADPKDLKRFADCKAKGKSDKECFKVGDNGIGCWDESTAQGTGPSCALPPDYMISKWGSIKMAQGALVLVEAENGKSVLCVLKDRMPWVKNLHSQARIDLNPDACEALGFKPPIMKRVVWSWA